MKKIKCSYELSLTDIALQGMMDRFGVDNIQELRGVLKFILKPEMPLEDLGVIITSQVEVSDDSNKNWN